MLYAFLAAGIFLLDTVLKYRAEKCLEEKKEKPLLGGRLYLKKYHNHGAAYGLFQKKPRLVRFFSVAVTLAAGFLFAGALKDKGRDGIKLGLAMLLGGAASNAADRVCRGYVVDYVGFGFKQKKLRRVIYNVSDFFILAGIVLAELKAILEL